MARCWLGTFAAGERIITLEQCNPVMLPLFGAQLAVLAGSKLPAFSIFAFWFLANARFYIVHLIY